jgi:hypothetical protein
VDGANPLAELRRQRAEAWQQSRDRGAEAAARAAAAAEPVAVLSYNVWFAHPETFARRMARLAQLADTSAPRPAALALQALHICITTYVHISPRITPRFPSRFAPQELTPNNLSLLRPGLLAAGYRAPFEQPLNQRSHNGQEAYFAALTTRAPLGPLVAPRFVPYASRRVHGMRVASA